MSELSPSLVPLDKGLNLQTAKLVAPVGSVLDALNYEQVDFQGQKRIDGFARYDGNLLPALDDFLTIQVDSTDWNAPAGAIVTTDEGILGIATLVDDDLVFVAVINQNLIPSAGDSIYWVDEGANTNAVTVVAVPESTDTVEEQYTNLLYHMAVLRSRVEELPGNIIGLHWFRDRLYAVADVAMVSLVGTTPIIYPNDMLSVDGGDEVKVLDSYVRDNTRLVFLSTLEPAPWAVEGAEVTRDAVPVGEIANGFEPIENEEEIASFFESRTEAQVLAEDGPSGPYDFGWRFVDHGWSVNFENGLSLFGSLPSLNQNITGLGVQGPTSVADNNGMPLVLLQKVDITNVPAQVNGWKSSQTPTSYELETDNLIDVDDETIYADAYISWNGTTGEVVGITDPLVEYPATNSVVIELP